MTPLSRLLPQWKSPLVIWGSLVNALPVGTVVWGVQERAQRAGPCVFLVPTGCVRGPLCSFCDISRSELKHSDARC